MKRFFILMALTACAMVANAQTWEFVDATSLTMVSNLFPQTSNPYHRIDTDVYKGFDDMEFKQTKMTAGLAIAFSTDSPAVSVNPTYGQITGGSIAQKGFDFYVKKNDKWLWAGMCLPKENGPKAVISHMEEGMVDCLIYLPLQAELLDLKIGVVPGSTIKPIDNPFRHRIAVFGSSFTHGTGCSRPGMTYCAQLSRKTGLQFINMGFGGHSKLQTYFAEALADADVDAFVFDGFSNPTAKLIEKRLFDFIEIIQAKHPGKPLIFQQTIYREWRNFNSDLAAKEEAKLEMAASMMKKAMKKYKDVYYVTTTNAADENHETTVDGTHPGDYGYKLWAESVRKPITDILAKYGIK